MAARRLGSSACRGYDMPGGDILPEAHDTASLVAERGVVDEAGAAEREDAAGAGGPYSPWPPFDFGENPRGLALPPPLRAEDCREGKLSRGSIEVALISFAAVALKVFTRFPVAVEVVDVTSFAERLLHPSGGELGPPGLVPNGQGRIDQVEEPG